MAGSRCRPKPRSRSRSRSRSRARSPARNPCYIRQRRTQTPPAEIIRLSGTASMPISPTERYCDDMSDQAARTLNCVSGILSKATSATSKYFIKQECDSIWAYGLRLLMGLMLFAALGLILRSKQMQQLISSPWRTAMHQTFSDPESIISNRGH